MLCCVGFFHQANAHFAHLKNSGCFPQFRQFFHHITPKRKRKKTFNHVLRSQSARFHTYSKIGIFRCVFSPNNCVALNVRCTGQLKYKVESFEETHRTRKRVNFRFGIFYELFVYFAWYANTQWMLVCLRLEQTSCQCWVSASEIM